MLVRIVALLAVTLIAIAVLAWVFSGERKYLKFAWWLFLFAFIYVIFGQAVGAHG